MTTARTPSRTGGYYYLLKAAIYRELIIWLRYPVNSAISILGGLFVFLLLFYGGTKFAGSVIGDSMDAFLVGYFLFILTNSAYQGVMGAVGAEASWGTLERHFLTPFGFGPVMLAKGIAILLKTFIQSSITLVVALQITGINIHIPLLTVLIIGFLTIAPVLGVGLAIGGLNVIYKKIGAINNFIGFAFIGLISSPIYDLGWLKIFPLAQGSALLQRTMNEGVRLWEFDYVALVILIGVAFAYLIAGYSIFRRANKRARRLGTLGDY